MKCYVHPDIDAVGTCTNCGKTVCAICATEVNGKIVCKQCVERMAAQAQQPAPATNAPANKKDPLIAVVLAFVGSWLFGFITLGAIYNGQIKKAIILWIAYWAVIILTVVIYFVGCFTYIGIICCLPVFILPIIMWLYILYDTYKTASRINDGEPVKDWLD